MKILTLDIETYPIIGAVWGLRDQNLGLDFIIEDPYVLCFAAKWHGEKKTHFHSVWDDTQEGMLKKAYDLVSQADAVISYNGQKFDIPTLNSEFARKGLLPTAPIKHIDLLRVARKQFRLPSYKLDYVAKHLGLGQKVKHEGINLWFDSAAGDAKAQARMRKYNIQDVVLTEKVYDRLLPWIHNHPNKALYELKEEPACPNCGSTHLTRRGYSYTATTKFARVCCDNCGKWSRLRTGEKEKPQVTH